MNFTPSPDTALILNHLLDIYERRDGQPKQVVRVKLSELKLPGYTSQLDPTPRVTTNEQLHRLAQADLLGLKWHKGQENHLLHSVSLNAEKTGPLYALLDRQPLAEQRHHLRDLLLAERTRFGDYGPPESQADWRRRAIDHTLAQLKAHKSPQPFSLTDADWNRDLLISLEHLPAEATLDEVPLRVFSVRVFNDSKRFESLKNTVARLARKHKTSWRSFSLDEVLRELGLVSNPSHIYCYGPWKLTDEHGQIMSLNEFYPAVGLPATLIARLKRVEIAAPRLICVENLASFYELIRHRADHEDFAALCLWGNPSPSVRRMLTLVPPSVQLELWADIDYGGLNILAHLRQTVDPSFTPRWMTADILRQHQRWAKPLTPSDERYLKRLKRRPHLGDQVSLIDELLKLGVKLEQEAIILKD